MMAMKLVSIWPLKSERKRYEIFEMCLKKDKADKYNEQQNALTSKAIRQKRVKMKNAARRQDWYMLQKYVLSYGNEKWGKEVSRQVVGLLGRG